MTKHPPKKRKQYGKSLAKICRKLKLPYCKVRTNRVKENK